MADPLSIVDGVVRVPDAPGLGVHLDPAALERLHRNYLDCGITRRDDAGYYRRFRTDFTVRTAVW